tara:strand:- start:202 stop:408 length:207 start_codon:yes stop_codon:yes gene_type:complete
MNARTLKKQLRAEMLLHYEGMFIQMDDDEQEEDMACIMGLEMPLTQNQKDRFRRVMQTIVTEALDRAG